MIDYGLNYDEFVIQEISYVTVANGSFFKSISGPLVLTNQNILFFELNFMGNVKEKHKYPISSIKKYDGQAQIKYDNQRFRLTIYLQNTTLNFCNVSETKNCYEFINGINKLLFGDDAKLVNSSIPFLNTFVNTINSAKEGLGINKKEKEKKVVKCEGCGCEVVGIINKVVNCPYCNRPTKIL